MYSTATSTGSGIIITDQSFSADKLNYIDMMIDPEKVITAAFQKLKNTKGVFTYCEIKITPDVRVTKISIKDKILNKFYRTNFCDEAFDTDPLIFARAMYTPGFDVQCGANKVADPEKKIFLRIAWALYDIARNIEYNRKKIYNHN